MRLARAVPAGRTAASSAGRRPPAGRTRRRPRAARRRGSRPRRPGRSSPSGRCSHDPGVVGEADQPLVRHLAGRGGLDADPTAREEGEDLPLALPTLKTGKSWSQGLSGQAPGLARAVRPASSRRPCSAGPASIICRSSFLSSEISSRSRAATSNCSSAAALCIWSVSCWISSARSRAGMPGEVGGVLRRSSTCDSAGHRLPWPCPPRGPWPRCLPGLEQLLGVLVLAGEHLGDVGDLLAQRLRVEAALGVVGDLLLAATVGLVDRRLHRRGDLVGVHDDLAGHVAGGAADRLDQRLVRAQEALLVGVEDRHQRHLGQVEALAQQVDADEDVVLAQPQLAQQLDALAGCRPRSAGSGCGCRRRGGSR